MAGKPQSKPIFWHEDCFRNSSRYLEEMRQEFENLKKSYEERITRLTADLAEYEKQIALAKAEGLDGFDRDRFNKKRTKKVKRGA